MTSESVVADVGGSGVRLATARDGVVSGIHHVTADSQAQFVDHIRSCCAAPRSVAVSMAGFVNSVTGHVRLSRSAPWAEGGLAARLRRELGCPVTVMNDGEAHALAMLRTGGVHFGAVAVALGTSVGIGVIGADRQLMRPCSGENWDLGDLRLHSRASNPSLWWALGAHGLRELESSMGTDAGARHFGHRLGAFFVQLAAVLQPRTIVVSGGIAASRWSLMQATVDSELTGLPDHFVRPAVVASPFPQAALTGAAHALTRSH